MSRLLIDYKDERVLKLLGRTSSINVRKELGFRSTSPAG